MIYLHTCSNAQKWTEQCTLGRERERDEVKICTVYSIAYTWVNMCEYIYACVPFCISMHVSIYAYIHEWSSWSTSTQQLGCPWCFPSYRIGDRLGWHLFREPPVRGRNPSKVWQRIKDNLEGQTHPLWLVYIRVSHFDGFFRLNSMGLCSWPRCEKWAIFETRLFVLRWPQGHQLLCGLL